MTEGATPNGQVAVREQPATYAPVPVSTPASLGLPENLGEQMQFADIMCQSNLVPKALQGNPANVLMILHKAIALHVHWDMALSGIHVIEGKVTLGAKMLRILLTRRGHLLDVHTITSTAAKATLTLAHRRNNPIEVEYTLAEAQTSGQANKSVWKQYTKSMLVAAVTRRAVDWYCPEVAAGMDLSEESVNDSYSDNGPVNVASEIVRDGADDAEIREGEFPDVEIPAQRTRDEAPDTVSEDPPAADPLRIKAIEILTEALQADNVGKLTALGKKARAERLLGQVVDAEGTTLKDALMARMRDVEAGQNPQG